MNKEIHVVGGGISGLTTAYFLAKKGFNVTLFEESDSLGGLIQTQKRDLGLAEWGATGWLNTPFMECFVDELQVPMSKENPENKKKFIYRNTMSRWPLRKRETLSFIYHLFVKNHLSKSKLKPHDKESIAQWGDRALGAGPSFYILQSALRGVYVGDASNLSASFILDRFFTTRHKKKKKKKRKGTISPQNGMEELIQLLEKALHDLGVQIQLNVSYKRDSYDQCPVVYCVPLNRLLEVDEKEFTLFKESIHSVTYGDLTSVTTFHPKDSTLPRGFGCLFAPDQNLNSLGAIFSDGLYHHNRDTHAMRWIFKGVEKEETILPKIRDDYKALTLKEPTILGYDFRSIPDALPMYDFALEDLYHNHLKKYERGHNRIFLHGNYMKGIGLAQIIEKSSLLASNIEEYCDW